MKLQGQEIEITRSEGLTEKDFSMRMEDAPHIFGILRDKLYSDKIAAPIREYSTNAIDAHIEAGIQDTPIVVTLPTVFEPKFKVRDFGKGLSKEGIFEVYVSYGRSTKRGSNDAIGQLGLGSKSGFTYGENFTITSYFEGVKYLYNAYIDETGLGKVALMHTEDSSEPSGVEISIPVKREDISAFLTRAKTIYSYFRVAPTIKGASNFEVWRPKYAHESKGWAVFDGSMYDRGGVRSVAVMGSIGYPLNSHAVPNLPADLAGLMNADLRLTFEIGELSISASREALEYTEHTVRSIKKKLRAIQEEVISEISLQIDDCKTEFEATKKVGDIMRNGSAFGRQVQILLAGGSLKWKGKTIGQFTLNSYKLRDNANNPGTPRAKAVLITDLQARGRYTDNWHSVEYNKNINFAIKDTTQRWTIRARALLAKLREDNPQACLLVLSDIADGKEQEVLSFLKLTKEELLSLDAVDIANIPDDLLDDIDLTVVAEEKVKNKKHSLQCFSLNWDDVKKSLGQQRSTCWVPAELDLDEDEGIYVELDRFYVTVNGLSRSVDCLETFKKHLELTGVDMSSKPIYGIKKKSIKSVGDKFVRFEKYAEEAVKGFLEENGVHQKVVDYQKAAIHLSLDVDRISGAESQFVDASSPLLEYADAVREVREYERIYQKYEILYSFYKDLGLLEEVTPTYDLDALKKKVLERYPLLSTLKMFSEHYNSRNLTHTDMVGVMHYINSIDSQE